MVVITQEVTLKQAARLDRQLVHKGKDVEHISIYVHYHPWRFSVAGEHCKEYEVKIEAAVSRYVDNRNRHTRDEAYSMLIMDISCDSVLASTAGDKASLRKIILHSLCQAYNLSEGHISFPVVSQEGEAIGIHRQAALPVHLLRSYPKSELCLRPLCGGMMIADTDSRLRCTLCARYKDSLQVA